MKCPHDGSSLQAIDVRGIKIDKCHQCDGLWLDHGELKAIREMDLSEIEEEIEEEHGNPTVEPGDVSGYMRCPCCGEEGRLIDRPTWYKTAIYHQKRFRYNLKNASYSIPWTNVRWVDMAYVGQEQRKRNDSVLGRVTSTSNFFDPAPNDAEGQGYGGHLDFSGFGSVPRRSMETKWTPLIDIVTDRIETVLRLDVERFNFRSTGQKVHASRQQNIWALCIGLVNAAPSAACGPGVRWVQEGGLPERQRVRSSELYDNLLSWRLTRISEWSEKTAIDKRKSPEPPEELSTRMAELVGLCKAFLEDGEVSLGEIKELIRWLRENRNLNIPSVMFLADVMGRIAADKVVTPHERHELKAAIEHMVQESDC